MRCSPRRTLLPAKIGRSSGNPSWDTAALRAAQRPDPDARGRRLKKRLQALR
nr:TonB C-terminal domain-containing protein [Paraburkholderia unamae]